LHNVVQEDRVIQHEAQLGFGVLAQVTRHCDSCLLVFLGVLFVFIIWVHLCKVAHLVGLALFEEYFVLYSIGHSKELLVENGEELFD